MRKDKLHKKKSQKFRLMLDAAFANVRTFPRLAKKTHLTHIVHTYNLPPTSTDEEIYQLAIKEKSFVLTINFKDFRRLVKRGGPGVIGIGSELSNKDIDILVSTFLSGKNPEDYIGKAVKL